MNKKTSLMETLLPIIASGAFGIATAACGWAFALANRVTAIETTENVRTVYIQQWHDEDGKRFDTLERKIDELKEHH